MKKTFLLILLVTSAVSSFPQKKSFYSIEGQLTGFPDGTRVSFYNRQTDGMDSITTIQDGRFFIKRPATKQPEFVYLLFDEKAPAVPILVQNEAITISGSGDDVQNLSVTGSALHTDYSILEKKLSPFIEAFKERTFTSENLESISAACTEFVTNHPASFASLLAISQNLQASNNPKEAHLLFNKVNRNVKKYAYAKILKNRIVSMTTDGIGTTIPEFSQRDIRGKRVNISDFRGQYVLIDFWASWCAPCRAENSNLLAAYERFKDKNFTVLGISLDDSKEAWVQAVKQDMLPWTQLCDLNGWGNEVARKFNIRSIPQNILIDPNGTIITKNLRGRTLHNVLERVLK